MSLHAYTKLNESMIRRVLHSVRGVRVAATDCEGGFQAALEVKGYRAQILMTIEHQPELGGNKCSFYAPHPQDLEEELDKYPQFGQAIRGLIFRLASDSVFNADGDLYEEYFH